MNRLRRKQLNDIVERLKSAYEDLGAIAEEERGSFENMTEGLQASERGQGIEENADNLEQACADLDEIVSTLTEIMEG